MPRGRRDGGREGHEWDRVLGDRGRDGSDQHTQATPLTPPVTSPAMYLPRISHAPAPIPATRPVFPHCWIASPLLTPHPPLPPPPALSRRPPLPCPLTTAPFFRISNVAMTALVMRNFLISLQSVPVVFFLFVLGLLCFSNNFFCVRILCCSPYSIYSNM